MITMLQIQRTVLFIMFLINKSSTKYLEGVIRTKENWVFVARFCFLSQKGRFEYNIEFNEEQGTPNLLFYYDTNEQWPSVYKSNKTCPQKESVLNRDFLQIINLTVTHPYHKIISGCDYQTNIPTTQVPKYTLNLPTRKRKAPKTTTSPTTVTDFFTSPSTESSFYDNFTTTETSYIENATEKIIEKRSIPRRLPFYQKRGHRTIVCRYSRSFITARERWWFLAFSNCDGNRGIHIKYKFLMTNGEPGDYWHQHFSADEFYVLPILMAFTIAYTFLLLGIVVCSMELKSRQLLHTTYKIYVASVILQFFGIVINSGVYLKYSINGIGPSKLKRFGNILLGASETVYLLLLLLMAKGYTITRGRLRLASSVKLTIFMCVYVVTYISIFIYEANVFDPGQVLYLYESPAGYSLIILRVLAWFMFIFGTIFTLKHYPEKANFYYPFNLCGTLWFIAGPAFILAANTFIDKWVRESVVCAVLQFITFGGHLTFLVLTMPSVANKNFPYHVRTTQIGIMELTNGTNGVSTIEQFGHHNYEPSSTTIEQTIVVPLTRRTEEIYEGMYSPEMHNTIRRESLNEHNMENVLDWSLAKNLAALEVPNFERMRKSPSLFSSSTNSLSSTELGINLNKTRSQTPNGHFDEIQNNREVPVELFTISSAKNQSSTTITTSIDST